MQSVHGFCDYGWLWIQVCVYAGTLLFEVRKSYMNILPLSVQDVCECCISFYLKVQSYETLKAHSMENRNCVSQSHL